MTTAIRMSSCHIASSFGRGKRMFHILGSLLLLFMATTLLTSCKKGSAEWKKGVASLNDDEYEDAVEHFKDSAEKGNIEAQMVLGFCYYTGMGTDPNPEKAEKQFRKAAKTGDPVAQAVLGAFLLVNPSRNEDGSIPDRDEIFREPLKYLKRSAEQDCLFGEFALAVCFAARMDSVESKDDKKSAMTWFKKVADRPLTDERIFMDDLKDVIMSSDSLIREFPDPAREAFEYLKDFDDELTAANLCIVLSQTMVAYLYADDRYGEPNIAEAEKWFKKAKQNGLSGNGHLAFRLKTTIDASSRSNREAKADRFSEDRW